MSTYTEQPVTEIEVGYSGSVHYKPQGLSSNYGIQLAGVARGSHVKDTVLRDVFTFDQEPDAVPTVATLRNLATGDESAVAIAARAGTVDTFDLSVDPVGEAEGDVFEVSLEAVINGRTVVIRKSYVVQLPLAAFTQQAADIVKLLEADTYIIPEETGLVLYYVERGTGTHLTGTVLLRQALYDVAGMLINDTSTFVARAVGV